MTYHGTVKNGVIVLDDGGKLPDGTRVRVDAENGQEEPASTLGERMLKLAGSAKNLPPDMAERHDAYLHGRPQP